MNIIFGDSFIGPFTLIKDDNLLLKKFKGKTMRGISKIDTEDYNTLYNIINVNKINKGIKYVCFMFGQAEILFSMYYEMFVKNNYNIKTFLEESSERYCKFLLSLKNIMNNKKVIFSICPLMLKDEEVIHSLYLYPIIDEEILKQIPKNLRDLIFSYDFRNNCRMYLNNLNKQFCKKYKMKFINYDEILIDKTTNKPLDILKVKESDYNIHPYFEEIIKLYLSKLNFMNINKEYKEDLTKSHEEYKNIKKELSEERYNNLTFIKCNENIDEKYNNKIISLEKQLKEMKEENEKNI